LFKQFFVVEKLFHYLFFISRRNAHVRTAIYAFHLNVCVTLASVSLRAIYASDFAVIVPTNRLKCIELSSHMSNAFSGVSDTSQSAKLRGKIARVNVP